MEQIVTYFGWIASFLVIGSYWLSIRRKNPVVLHWGNVVGAIILVPAQIYLGVGFAALLSACFGLLAAQALCRYWREPSVSIVTPQGVTVVE